MKKDTTAGRKAAWKRLGKGTGILLEALGPFCFLWPVTLIGPYCPIEAGRASSTPK